jgi:coenzyme F420-reducing hydrogenase beta subunit
MEMDKEGFSYPKIDTSRCINCGLCSRVCPILAKHKKESELQKTFACINKDERKRLKSSSGGVFTALAELVLEQNGIVFGAGFDDHFNVCHQFIENKAQIEKLRSSKYVQSDMRDNFTIAKTLLDAGRLVLFTGTECQIAGLKSFLGKDYEKLITQGLICHGVPSPLIWKNYIEFRKNEKKSEIESISFRDKTNGWKNYTFVIAFKNGETYSKPHLLEPYLNMFIFNKILRPSCYNCQFKGLDRQSDITLADFWGGAFKRHAKQMDDNKGCSLVLIHSKKGQFIMDQINNKIDMVEVSTKSAIRKNPSALKSPLKPFRRKAIMNNLHERKLPFNKFVKKYGKILF